MQAVNRKTGARIIGTEEMIPGTALIDPESFELGKDGRLSFDHAGDTTVGWDGQETLTNADGHTLFVDDDGNTCTQADIDLTADPDESDDAQNNVQCPPLPANPDAEHLRTILANLKDAARTRNTVAIGAGIFTAAEYKPLIALLRKHLGA